MAPSLIIAGAHVICYVNGRVLGAVTGFSFTPETPSREIYGIDSPEPFELAPTITKVSGQVQMYRLVGSGGLEGPGITSHFVDLPAQKYFVVQLIERRTDTVVFEATNCLVQSQNWSVAAKGWMQGSFTFKGLSWSNEVKPANTQ